MNTSIVCKVVTVTPEDAKLIRSTCHFQRQRIISDRNIARLSSEMLGRRFIQGTPVFFCRLPDGRLLLVNGNHTLESIIASGIAQQLVFIILDVPDEEEAARIYGTMDVHKVRTWADALRAVGLADEITAAKRIMPALGVILAKFEYVYNTPEAASSRSVRFDLMKHYAEEATLLQGALIGSPLPNQRAVWRAAVCSVALECCKYQPLQALEFWRGLAQDDGLAKDDPRKALLRWLLNNGVSGGSAGWPTQSRAAAHAWAAFCKGQSLSIIRPSNAAAFALYGTPWQGKGAMPTLIRDALAALRSESASESPSESAPAAAPAPASSGLGDLLDIGLFAAPTGLQPVAFAADPRR